MTHCDAFHHLSVSTRAYKSNTDDVSLCVTCVMRADLSWCGHGLRSNQTAAGTALIINNAPPTSLIGEGSLAARFLAPLSAKQPPATLPAALSHRMPSRTVSIFQTRRRRARTTRAVFLHMQPGQDGAFISWREPDEFDPFAVNRFCQPQKPPASIKNSPRA